MTFFPRLTSRLEAGEPVTICLFGSSTTEGVGASSPEHGFAPIFARTFEPFARGGLAIVNLGIGGNGAREMHARLQPVLNANADLVIWQGGTNDAWQNVPLAEFEDLTRKDLSTLRESGADLAMIGPQWSRMMEECAAFPAFRDATPALGRELGVPVFDRYGRMKSWCAEYGMTRDDLSPDGLHMGDFGYRLLGEAVANWVIELTGAAQAWGRPAVMS